MANNQVNRGNVDAGLLAARQPRPVQPPLQLEVVNGRAKAPRPASGSDPYNTSGSFDRTRNWARVGKR